MFIMMVVLMGPKTRSEGQGGRVRPSTAPLWMFSFGGEEFGLGGGDLHVVRHHQVELFVPDIGRDGVGRDGTPLDEEDELVGWSSGVSLDTSTQVDRSRWAHQKGHS